MLLRVTQSWSLVLSGALVVVLLLAVLLALLSPSWLASLGTVLQGYEQLLTGLQEGVGAPSQENTAAIETDYVQITGLLASTSLQTGMIALLLARWLQSLLYHPGGFSAEFFRLQLQPWLAMVCIFLAAVCYLQGYGFWASVFIAPLVLAALAIVHCLASRRQIASSWLILFYLLLLLASPVSAMILATVGLADAWLRLRRQT